MDAQTIVNEINRKLNGEFEVIDFDSDDWNTIVSALNENIDLYNKKANWRTSYDPMYVLGSVSDSEFYEINYEEVGAISGSNRTCVFFYDSAGKKVDSYKLVSQDIFDESYDNDKVVAINMNGLQIKPKTSTDKIYGCDIVLPIFKNVGLISKKTDTVVTDDNYWLITKTAANLSATSPVAFIARNFDSFERDAERRMMDMKKNNRVTQSSTPAIGQWNPSTRPDGR
jgi:hypothetical protein